MSHSSYSPHSLLSPVSPSPPPSSTSSAFPPASSDTRLSTADYPSQTSTSKSTTSPSFHTSTRRYTPPPQADESPAPLHDNLADLEARLRRFDARLSGATAVEAQFRSSIQSWTNALDAFIYRHVADDRHLSRLIRDDTQRSLDVKEGYDALASMLVPHVCAPSPTRVRNALALIWAYVGIVLSLVFFAPVHALWTFASRRLAPPPPPPIPSVATRRRSRARDDRRLSGEPGARTRPSTSSTASATSCATGVTGAAAIQSSPVATAVVSAATAGGNESENGSEGEFLDALGESQGAVKRGGVAGDELWEQAAQAQAQAQAQAPTNGARVTTPAAVTGGGGLEEVGELGARSAERSSRVDAVLRDNGRDGGMVKAVRAEWVELDREGSIASGEGLEVKEGEEGEEGEDEGEEEGSLSRAGGRRPGWAEPSETWSDEEEEATREAAFPTADFFNISEEDMQLDLLRDGSTK